MLSEPHKLFKLIWQKKKCCDYKSWTIFFLFYSRDWQWTIPSFTTKFRYNVMIAH